MHDTCIMAGTNPPILAEDVESEKKREEGLLSWGGPLASGGDDRHDNVKPSLLLSDG